MTRKQLYWTGGVILFLGLALLLKNTGNKSTYRQDLSGKKIPTLRDWKKKYPGVKEFVFEAQSQSLPANFLHPGRTVQEEFILPEDGWLVGFKPDQVGATHALHHADIIDPNRSNFFCANGMPNVVSATGEELTPGFLPLGYGYPISKHSRFIVSLMYHNESAVPLEDVHAKLTFYYIPKNAARLTSSEPFFFDAVGPCLWGEYTVPPKIVHTKQMRPEYRVEKPGQIIFMGIHMHHYAKSLSFYLNGKPVKTFTVENSEEGKKLTLPKYVPKYLRLEKGDRVGVEAVYDNATDKPLDAMAEVLLYFVPDTQ